MAGVGSSLGYIVMVLGLILSSPQTVGIGVVIFGAVRDVDEIDGLNLGVKALGSVPLKTDKRGEGQTNIVLRFGGVRFVPGHFVAADNNGVIVSAKNLLNA